jgi:hypothetical protein
MKSALWLGKCPRMDAAEAREYAGHSFYIGRFDNLQIDCVQILLLCIPIAPATALS